MPVSYASRTNCFGVRCVALLPKRYGAQEASRRFICMPVETPNTQRRTFCIGRSAIGDASFLRPSDSREGLGEPLLRCDVGEPVLPNAFGVGVFLLSEPTERWIGFSEDDHNRRRREYPTAAIHKTAGPENFRDCRIARCLGDGLKVPLRLISNSQSVPCSRRSSPGLSPRIAGKPGRWGRSLRKIVSLYQFEYSSKDEPDYFGDEWGYVLQGR